MGNNPQSRQAQIHTLEDMMRDVESDEVLRGILKSTQQFDKLSRPLVGDPGRRASYACPGLTARRISRIAMVVQRKKVMILQSSNLYFCRDDRFPDLNRNHAPSIPDDGGVAPCYGGHLWRRNINLLVCGHKPDHGQILGLL